MKLICIILSLLILSYASMDIYFKIRIEIEERKLKIEQERFYKNITQEIYI